MADDSPSFAERVKREWGKAVGLAGKGALDLAHADEQAASAIVGPQGAAAQPTSQPYSEHVNFTPPPTQTPAQAGRAGLVDALKEIAPALFPPLAPSLYATAHAGDIAKKDYASKVKDAVGRAADPAYGKPVAKSDEGGHEADYVDTIGGGGGQASAQVGGGGPGAPPGWQDMRDPERVKEIEEAQGKEKEAARFGAESEADADQRQAAALRDIGDQQRVDADLIGHDMKSQNAVLQSQMEQLDRGLEEARSQRIDPEHYWHSQSTGSKALMLIGAFLGGFGAHQRGGQNPALQMLQANIERDTQAQAENIGNNFHALETQRGLLADNMRRYGDLRAAVLQTNAQKYAAMAREAEALSLEGKGAQARANGQMLVAQLEEKAAEQKQQAEKIVGGGGVAGPVMGDLDEKRFIPLGANGEGVYAPDEATARTAREGMAHAQETARLVDRAKELRKGLVGQYTPEKYRELTQIQNELSMSLTRPGVPLRGPEVKMFGHIVGNLHSPLGTVDAGLDALKRTTAQNAQAPLVGAPRVVSGFGANKKGQVIRQGSMTGQLYQPTADQGGAGPGYQIRPIGGGK